MSKCLFFSDILPPTTGLHPGPDSNRIPPPPNFSHGVSLWLIIINQGLCGVLRISCSKSWFTPLTLHHLVNSPQSTPYCPVLFLSTTWKLTEKMNDCISGFKCFYTFMLVYTCPLAIYKNFNWIILTHFYGTQQLSSPPCFTTDA